jgi:hypothetical protein
MRYARLFFCHSIGWCFYLELIWINLEIIYYVPFTIGIDGQLSFGLILDLLLVMALEY